MNDLLCVVCVLFIYSNIDNNGTLVITIPLQPNNIYFDHLHHHYHYYYQHNQSLSKKFIILNYLILNLILSIESWTWTWKKNNKQKLNKRRICFKTYQYELIDSVNNCRISLLLLLLLIMIIMTMMMKMKMKMKMKTQMMDIIKMLPCHSFHCRFSGIFLVILIYALLLNLTSFHYNCNQNQNSQMHHRYHNYITTVEAQFFTNKATKSIPRMGRRAAVYSVCIIMCLGL